MANATETLEFDAGFMDDLPGLIQIESVLFSRKFRMFVEAAWKVIEPSTPFVGGFHIDAICEHLEAVSRGQIPDLLITIPPRFSKSTLVSVMWPAWEWTFAPERRFLTASYAGPLAIRDAVRTRRLISSQWYEERWGHVFKMSGDQNLKTRYENTKTGYRIATSVGGGTLGEGGDRVVVDDPHNMIEISSDLQREAALIWWDEAMSTRLNSKRSARVVVQQRLHERDLAGHIIEQGGYVHLNLPMEYEGDKTKTVIGWSDPRTDLGQYLSPDRFGPEEKVKMMRTLGIYGYAGQYQQRPAPAEGGMFKRDAWGWYERRPDKFIRTAAFVDPAAKKGKLNDYTAIAFWGEMQNGWYMLDLVHEKLSFPELIDKIKMKHLEWRPGQWVIEDTSNGVAVIQSLKSNTRLPVKAYNPGIDKISRASAASPYQVGGRLYLPMKRVAKFDVDLFIKEHGDFPNGRHDDIVDTTTMMLLFWEIMPPEEKAFQLPVYTGRTRGWGYGR